MENNNVNPLAELFTSAPAFKLPSPLDTLKRSDYASDAAYLEACAELHLKRQNPEFQKALLAVRDEFEQREHAARLEKMNKEIKKLSQNIVLQDYEIKKCDEQAAEQIWTDVARGNIEKAKAADAIQELSIKLQREARERKASRQVTNELIRATI